MLLNFNEIIINEILNKNWFFFKYTSQKAKKKDEGSPSSF